jgi:type IV pilus assembly protein PilM
VKIPESRLKRGLWPPSRRAGIRADSRARRDIIPPAAQGLEETAMAGTQAVWGIDVGRCALKAIKLRAAADGKVDIVAHDYVEHAKILSQPDADRHSLIGAALEKFLSHNDISKDQIVVSVPGQHTLARFTKLPPVAPKRIPDIVRYEADQQIPFDMDEVIWDYQTFQQEGLPDLEVGIFAMKRELIREHLLHFEQAAIEPIGVQSGPLAVYNMAHFDGLVDKDTIILLDIGAENTDLVVATTESLWTRTIPIGGNSFTEALVKSFKLSFSKAENLKRTAATSKYARQIFQAMRPIFADLVQELQRSIGFYSTTHRDTKVEKVVGVGNAFLLPGLQKYLQQNLGLTVDRPETFRNVVPSPIAEQAALREQLLSFAVAYGLALQGLELTKVTSNLLPTEIAKQVVWRKKRPAFAAAAACLVLAGGLIWFRQTSDMGALAAGGEGIKDVKVTEAQAPGIIDNGPPSSLSPRAMGESVVQAAKELKKKLGALTGKGQSEHAETEKLIELQHNKTTVLKILQTIHDSVPVPEGPLSEATTQKAVLDAIASGAPPRGQRKQVFIESVDMLYDPDLRQFNWESKIEVPPPINDHSAKTVGELAGILIKITCTTPNEGGLKFIKDSFMVPLRQNGRKPGAGFYIDNVVLVEGGKAEAAATGGAPRPATGRGTTRGGAGTPTTGSAASAGRSEKIDVVTYESTDNDWRFEIWADAILDDFSEAGEKKEAPPPKPPPKGPVPPPKPPKPKGP